MDDTKWNDIDKSSRQLVKAFFRAVNADNVEDSHGNCSYDLKVQLKGKTILVEVKDRTFPHDRYGDVFAEGIKKTCNNRRIANGEADKCWVVNVFTDYVFCIADINDKRAKVSKKWCPETTLVDDASHELMQKTTLSLPQTMKVKFFNYCGNLKFKKLQ